MNWKKVKLNEVLKQYRVQHIVQDILEYRQVSILNNGNVTLRGSKIGKEIGRKRQFVIDLNTYPNTLIFTRQLLLQGSIGIAPNSVNGCIVTENMPMFSIQTSEVDKDFLIFFLQSEIFKSTIRKIELSGSAQKSIHEKTFLDLEFSFPEIEFQKKIVVELLQLNLDSSNISAEVNQQFKFVKQLRQAFLREAMQGKLIKSTNTKETGQQLLEKIKVEKAQLIADKKIKVGKLQEAEIIEGLLFKIPEHWTWCNLDDICYNITDGTHQTPIYTKFGRIFLSAQNVKPFKFMPEKHKFVSEEDYQLYIKNKKPEKGDLLIGRVGAGIGETAVIDQELDFCIYVSLALVQPFKELVDSEYLAQVFNSPYGVKYSKGNISSKGGSAGNFNLGRIRSFQIPLPPLQEQIQIVRRLKELMIFCDCLEQSVNNSQIYNEQLLQQVLREALQLKEEAVVDSLFENKSYDLYVAMMQKLIENQLHINYGEVATQKTVFHLNTFTDEKIPYSFINSNYGTYSFQLKDDLLNNSYLTKSKIGNGEVFVVKANKEKEVKDALARPENKSFVDAVKKVLTIYENPVINKETEKVELLNTVSKMMIDFQTSDLEIVYEGMKNWEIKQKGFKNKAEKFSKLDTKNMLTLISKKELLKNFIK